MIFIAALTLVSCKSFNGNLETVSDVTLKTKKGEVLLPAGEYTAKVKFTSKRKATFYVNGEKLKVKFTKGFELPESGDFCINKADWNQDFKACGSKDETISYGELRSTTEFCEMTFPVPYCSYRGRCGVRYEIVQGTRFVDYRIKTIKEGVSVNLTNENGDLGTFDATNTRTQRIYEYQGACRF